MEISHQHTNQYGCQSVDTITITKCPDRIRPPSAFTPNGDGHNEVWEIDGINRFEDAIIVVYDRFGNKVFESDIPYQPWDGKGENGKLLPVDSYHYIIKLNDEEDQIEIGQVTIAY